MKLGPIGGRLGTNDIQQQIDTQSRQQPAKQKSVFEKIGTFFLRVIGGRIGAKAGHHSILGSFFKIGLQTLTGLKKIIKKPIAPPHTYTFKELTKEKAQYLMPWVNASKIANAMDFPDAYKTPENNFGLSLRDSVKDDSQPNLLLNNINLDDLSELSNEEKILFQDVKSICSEEAYISPTGVIVDPKSGLRAAVTKDPEHEDRFIVSFGSTGSMEDTDDRKLVDKQGSANLKQYIGLEPDVYNQAKQLVGAVIKLCGKDNVSTAGHSLGGGLAQYSALYQGVRGKCFNASPLGVGLQQILGNRIHNAGELIEHISVRGDWLSHSGAALPIGVPKWELTGTSKTGPDTRPRILSRIADLLGLRTRGNFGIKYYMNFDKGPLREAYVKAFKKEHPNIPVERNDVKQWLDNLMEKKEKSTTTRHCRILNQISFFAEQ